MSSSRTSRRRVSKAVDYALLGVLAAIMFAPIYYLVIGSFKPSEKVLDGFAGFLPTDMTFRNYANVFASLSSPASGYFWAFMGNSVVISAGVVIGGLIINSMAGYAFSRLQWKGRDQLFLLVILLVIVPFESVAVPLVYLLNGQRDTLGVQVLPFVANAFSIFLFYTFFLNLPKSVEEAARLDGLGPFGVFARVVVPNARPVFATVAILTFLSSWGSYLWPSLITSDPSVRPLPLEISVFSAQQPVDWGATFAFGTMLVLPVLIVFLAFQRYFVQSVAGSAVKG